MTTLLKKVARGELPGQRNKSSSPSGSKSRSPTGSSESSPTGRVIPPEPVQQAVHGDFSLLESERPLQVHNLARASKLSKALDWDVNLARDAAAYAETLASTGILERSGLQTVGENLYYAEGDATYEDAIDTWLNQEKKYDGNAIDTEGGGLAEFGYFSELRHSQGAIKYDCDIKANGLCSAMRVGQHVAYGHGQGAID